MDKHSGAVAAFGEPGVKRKPCQDRYRGLAGHARNLALREKGPDRAAIFAIETRHVLNHAQDRRSHLERLAEMACRAGGRMAHQDHSIYCNNL